MLASLAAAVLLAGGYDGGHLLFRFSDPRITESSGLVAASRSDLLLTHNDSGDVARFFAVNAAGRTAAVFTLKGVQARDWEDISRGPGRTLWLGDIGDNSGTRDRGLLVHRVAEPTLASPRTLTPTTYRLRYDDGPKDAEALMVTPAGRPLIVEKTLGTVSRVYAPDLPLKPGGAVNLMHVVAEVHVPVVTGGDISPDGHHLVLRNYVAAYEWDIPGDDVIGALNGEPTRIGLPITQQGEGIAYSRDGRALLTSSEGEGAPVYELRRTAAAPAATPTPPAAQAAPRSPAAGHAPASGWRLPLTAAAALLLAGVVATAIRHRRS